MKLKGMHQLQNELKQAFKAEKQILEKSNELVSALKVATPVKTGKARDGWRYENNSIINDVEYIDELNQGTSKQAPSNFIESTLLAQEGIKPNGVIVVSRNAPFTVPQ